MDNEIRDPLIIHEHREPVKTLRDEFAMASLQGWLSSFGPEHSFPVGDATRKIAEQCYLMADAMCEAREKK